MKAIINSIVSVTVNDWSEFASFFEQNLVGAAPASSAAGPIGEIGTDVGLGSAGLVQGLEDISSYWKNTIKSELSGVCPNNICSQATISMVAVDIVDQGYAPANPSKNVAWNKLSNQEKISQASILVSEVAGNLGYTVGS